MKTGDERTLLWLDADDPRQVVTWAQVWARTAARRPHDHPGFLALQRSPQDHAVAVVYTVGESRVLYPFYWRSLDLLPYGDGTPAIHLVSPYGYGGPLFEGPQELHESVSMAFEEAFHEALALRGAVSEFVREDIFDGRLARRSIGERRTQQPNVAVRLDGSPEEIWGRYKHKVRKNVNAARRANLRVRFDSVGEGLEDFVRVYHATMERTGAARAFFLDIGRFRALNDSLGREGGLLYVHVLDGDTVVSTELVLLSADCMYSFLGGTLASSFEKRPNDLLKHETILWGRARGFRTYVLGGGFSPGDGIYAYKQAFDPEGVLPFQVRRVQHDPERYQRLVELREAYEREQGRDWVPRDDFFPAFLS